MELLLRLRSGRQPYLRLGAPSLRRRGKGGGARAGHRSSRGGRTTKIHAVAGASGRPIAFDLSPGQWGDIRAAPGLIEKLPKAAKVLADTAYDSDSFQNS